MFAKTIQFLLRHTLLSVLVCTVMIVWGVYSVQNTPVDAIPDLGQNQVIVLTEWEGQSPKDIENQISYPLSVALLSVPKAESVRGKSMFGFSFVQVTFSDDTDYYWARSRVLEQLQLVSGDLPASARSTLGPDATALGQIFYYTLKPSKPMDLAELRSLQDYVVKYALQSVPGVSEVASIGGYQRQYQVEVDPEKLRLHGVPLAQLMNAVKSANTELGAKTIEQSEMEFIIRGKGFLGGGQGSGQVVSDLEEAVLFARGGVPLRVKDLARVTQGTAFRRGGLDLNGGEAVGGIVIMRLGENPEQVIQGVKDKIASLEPSLDGVKIQAIYDRTDLIEETTSTLSKALFHEILITILVILLFLRHIKTSLVVAAVLPLSILLTFIIMRLVGLEANIMSLAGIAIAIGNMVDMGIVIAENIYTRLTRKSKAGRNSNEVIAQATSEVGSPLLTATATTVVSFLPVFFLTGRDYKLFAPLVETKTLALLATLLVSLLIVPLLSRYFMADRLTRFGRRALPPVLALVGMGLCAGYFAHWTAEPLVQGLALILIGGGFFGLGLVMSKETLRPIDENPVSQLVRRVYAAILGACLRAPRLTASLPLVFLVLGLFSWERLEIDDWIALDEGSLFYMPTLYPAVSYSKAMQVLQTQDTSILQIPEVQNVLGKIGRADTALDPAPAAMIETYVMLKPKSEWREGVDARTIWNEVTERATLPGVTPASFLQPIEGRVLMLQSGIKANMAIRIYGDELKKLAIAASDIAGQLKTMGVVNPTTVNPDIVLGKPYVEFEIDRRAASRYGLSVDTINKTIALALDGHSVAVTTEGRQQYPVRVRYQRDYVEDIAELSRIPLVTPSGQQLRLQDLAKLRTVWGPAGISSENARLVAHVAFSPSGSVGALETVDMVRKSLAEAREAGNLTLPTGYELEAVGSFQNQVEANRTLMWVVPLVGLINLMIIYLMFGRWILSLLIFAGIPLAFGGGMFLLALLGVKLNTAIWVGFIALFGLAVDNGVILASHLERLFKERSPKSLADLRKLVIEASLLRVRPCLMTTATTILALLPVLLATGRGAELAGSMALPIFAGMFSALLLLLVLPAAYLLLNRLSLPKKSDNLVL